mmetsp:Transcript_7210/g.15982  ORF Transcript_7210/g.15982 Transcript_7210/m.15982 type:complete len:952 (+) Transcript_7210:81-2936(+)|eukprot:4107064-Pleurochrysis_carterae.AAC.2
MGWGKGAAKGQIIQSFAGDLRSIEDFNPFANKPVLVDASGWGHRASKRGAEEVARYGTSAQQQQYIRSQLDALEGVGAIIILVLDGHKYPPKHATQSARRNDQSAAHQQALAAQSRGDAAGAESAWKLAAVPQEPYQHWLLEECLRRSLAFVVSWFEADAQLAALSLDLTAEGAVILAASQDSDLILFAPECKVIYDWDPVKLTYRQVCLHTDVLGCSVTEWCFEGWNYDRFLCFAMLSGNDYFQNFPGWGLRKVYKAMSSTPLPPELIASSPHPLISERPLSWSSPDAIALYVSPVLSRVFKDDAEHALTELSKLRQAYYALVAHPVYRVVSIGPDRLLHSNIQLSPLVPLSDSELRAGAVLDDWPSVVHNTIALPIDDAITAAWAKGLIKVAPAGDTDYLTRVLEMSDNIPHYMSPDEDGQRSDLGDEEVAVAASAGDITLDNLQEQPANKLRAFLVQHAVEPYATTSLTKLRALCKQLLAWPGGVPPVCRPLHPALARYSRQSFRLSVQSPQHYRGTQVFDCVKRLQTVGLHLDQETRSNFLPFENVRRRGERLYHAGKSGAGVCITFAHTRNVAMQPASFCAANGPRQDCFIFKMRCHASMRSVDHLASVAITDKEILLAPNSVCSCEVGIACSHQYCLLLVLFCMQVSESHDDFLQRVPAYTAAAIPSGSANWWPDFFPRAMNTQRSAWERSTVDAKIAAGSQGGGTTCPTTQNVPGTSQRAASRNSVLAALDTSHVSGGIKGYHHSEKHIAILKKICFVHAFRNSALAHTFRHEYGHLAAPPVPPSRQFAASISPEVAEQDAGGNTEVDADSSTSSIAGRVAQEMADSVSSESLWTAPETSPTHPEEFPGGSVSSSSVDELSLPPSPRGQGAPSRSLPQSPKTPQHPEPAGANIGEMEPPVQSAGSGALSRSQGKRKTQRVVRKGMGIPTFSMLNLDEAPSLTEL